MSPLDRYVTGMGYTKAEHERKVGFWLSQFHGVLRWYPNDVLRSAGLAAIRLELAIRHLIERVR